MAAILRSSVIQTVRRAFSGEGTLSVRALHTGRNNPTADASCAKKNLKPAELKLSKDLVDEVLYYMTYVFAAGSFLFGYEVSKDKSLAKKCQESSGKKARQVDDLI